MERTEILLIIILIISLLSLWFSYQTYSKKMRRYRPGCRLLSENYAGEQQEIMSSCGSY